MGRRKNVRVRRDPEGNGRGKGGVADSDEVDLWAPSLLVVRFFSSSPKSDPGIQGGDLK